MSDAPQPLGAIAWHDLTVDNADQVRDFYADVVGWTPVPVDMGGYADYDMRDPDGHSMAGICHARGGNAGLPPQWLIYVLVADVDGAADRAGSLGGAVIDGPRDMGGSRMCVVRDPAGAVLALYQVPEKAEKE